MDTAIELSIPWPARRRATVQLGLHVVGKTVRVENCRVAVQFNRAVFRTIADVRCRDNVGAFHTSSGVPFGLARWLLGLPVPYDVVALLWAKLRFPADRRYPSRQENAPPKYVPSGAVQ